MVKKFDWVEIIGISVSVITFVAMCFFHISWKEYLGIKEVIWDIIGSIATNVLFITMALIIWVSCYSPIMSKFFLFSCGYFLIKLVYHITCALDIRIWSKVIWENVWSVLAGVYLVFLVYMGFNWVKKRKC